MNRTSVLGRKLIYLVVLIAMLVPLYLLGQPAGGGTDVGGRLSVMRHNFNIAESDLGEISPASQTMKLASLGLRGVAATLLWNKAHEYRVTHEWDRLKAAVNNIALLQPHSDKVWEFHAHNLTYNVSTEFDDYRQRYEMVREGTEFLQRGVRQNRNATRLIWYTGWFYGSKMGMSDEKTQFRKLFADDEILHEALLKENIAVDSPEARGPLGKPDNWLVGRLWLNRGYDLVDTGVVIRRQTPLNFYETGPKWRIKHAEAIEKEGILDDRAQTRWQMANEDWRNFGDRSIPTTSPFTIKLGHLEDLKRRRQQRMDEFKELTGEAFSVAQQERLDQLPPQAIALWNKPEDERTAEEDEIHDQIEAQIMPDLDAVAKKSDPDSRLRAIELVTEMKDISDRLQKTNGYRTQINYPYWQTLSEAEQEERTVEARKLIYDAEQANANADIDNAIELYEKAFTIWAEIFDDYPILTTDDTADDLTDSIRHYMIAIDSEDFPEDFPLMSFIELQSQDPSLSSADAYLRLRAAMQKSAEQKDEASEEPPADSDSPKSDAAESVAPTPTAEPAGGNKAEKTETKSNEPPSPESDSPSAEPAEKDAGEATEASTAPAETEQADADNADTPKSEGDTAESDSDEA
jgi:hypothetical protein